MDKEEATRYLRSKGKIKGVTKYNSDEEEMIKKVEKEGRIFGDPAVILN